MASFLPVNDSATSHEPVPGNPTASVSSRPSSQIGIAGTRTSSNRDETTHTAHDPSDPLPNIASSHRKAASVGDEVMHGESDGDRDGSDNETDSAGGAAPPSKKKKGQRFFCTEFPPCNLSFTRSEHLARHIRKHTGERPFQCHCSRRFSRLDNLRQHAQTVHINEDIPGDSLAATGTRFQRQIRTERIRPQGRPRAGTAGSAGPHSRGHSRNLSTSSIASTTSTFSQAPELRRRPPPLIMAGDATGRARLPVDPYGEPPRTPPGQVHAVPGQSVVGSPYATPVMGGPAVGGSPHFASPISHAYGFWEGKTAARRLSVPSGTNPFLPQHAGAYPMSYAGSTTPSAYSGSGGVYASPTSSHYSPSRDEGGLTAAEAEMRRRTWHPSTYSAYSRPGTSGLSHYQTPETMQPSFEPTGPADQPTRLPGIESFDKIMSQQRPLTPPHRKRSPMQVDSQPGPPGSNTLPVRTPYQSVARPPPPPVSGPGHRRGNISWDMSLHRNLTGLEIRDRTPLREAPQWGQQTIAEIQSVASRPSPSLQQPPSHAYSTGPQKAVSSHPQLVNRTSPEDSSSSEGVHTPSTAPLEYHPAIVHSNGYIESHHPPLPGESQQQTGCAPLPAPSGGYHAQSETGPRPHYYPPSAREPGMDRLEALVAVATNENKAATKFFV